MTTYNREPEYVHTSRDNAKAFYWEWLRGVGYNPFDWEDRGLLDYIADYLDEYCEENDISNYADVPGDKLEDIALSVTEF